MAETRLDIPSPGSSQVRAASPSGMSDISDGSEEAVMEIGLPTHASVVPHGRSRKRFWSNAPRFWRESSTTRSFNRWKKKHQRPLPGLLPLLLSAVLAIFILATLLIYYTIHLRSMIPQNDIQRVVESWGKPGTITGDLPHSPTAFSRGITPIPCHSHNDYERAVPLFDALMAGCTSVEADVWYSPRDLLVGHTINSLTETRTLQTLYIDPIVNILSHQNPDNTPVDDDNTTVPLHGMFDEAPTIPLVFFIDIKNNPGKTFQALSDAIEPFRSRGWLTHFNGSTVIDRIITVVASGDTPFDVLNANSTYRDIFFDAPLADLFGENAPRDNGKYTSLNSYYASTNFEAAIGKLWHGELKYDQVERIRGQKDEAQKRGLKVRYWNTPKWPQAEKEHVWDVLVREGVDILSVDDLEGVKKRNWGKH